MSTKEKLEKSIKRLNSLVETASKCGDNGLVREATSKLALYNSILQDLERLEKLEEDLKYLANQEIQQFVFLNGRTILGVDITSMPSEKEKIKRMIERTLKEVLVYER